jgi:ankyrin repeat protein
MKKTIGLLAVLLAVVQLSYAQTLQQALDKKDTVAALELLKGGSDINGMDSYGSSALMTACRWADEPMVSFILRHGATADNPKSPKGRTCLMIACAYYSGKSICRMLIDKGANVNAAANDGTTPLMLAAQNAKLDVVELLLKAGANPKAKDAAGRTALDYARKADVGDYRKQSVKDTRLDKDAVVKMLEGK